MAESDPRSQTVERTKRKRAFRSTAITFALIVALLIAIWAIAGGGFFWPVFPLIALGIALGFQAWGTFGHEKPATREMDRGA